MISYCKLHIHTSCALMGVSHSAHFILCVCWTLACMLMAMPLLTHAYANQNTAEDLP